MTNHEIEGRIRRAFGHEAPDALPGILSDCEKRKGTVMVMEKKKRNPWVARTVGIAAAVAVCVMGGLGFHLYGSRFAVASTVSLDVNPSIEIRVNSKEHVLKVEPRNEDGRKVVGDMDFSGSSLDVTVNALIGSMLRNGYLNENANSILISVDTRDAAKGAALREKLALEVDSLLQTDSFSGAVLSQTVTADTALQQLAEKYGISQGKAQLIQEIAAGNPTCSIDTLARLSIHELNLLMANNVRAENVASSGTASDKAYIGAEKATSLALEHANVAADLAVVREAKLDTEDGTLVYEIEFEAGGYEYEYDINAITGAVVKFEKEYDDDARQPDPDSTPGSDIGEAKAREAALAHAGVAEADIRDYKIERDTDDGVLLYEIGFKAGGYEYEYDIDAATGSILKFDKEADDAPLQNPNPDSAPGSDIGEAKARETALAHAGVAEADVRDYKIERDTDDGVRLYEIEFKAGGYEYEYEIRAADGAVMKHHKELDD